MKIEVQKLQRIVQDSRASENSTESATSQETIARALSLIGNTLRSLLMTVSPPQQSTTSGNGMVQQIFSDPRSIVPEFHGHEESERARVWNEEL